MVGARGDMKPKMGKTPPQVSATREAEQGGEGRLRSDSDSFGAAEDFASVVPVVVNEEQTS